MNAPLNHPGHPEQPVTGSGMDRRITRSRRQRFGKPMAIAALVLATALAGWWSLPRGYAVKAGELDIATVRSGEFRDELVLRANATPLASIVLDATEGGRVEAIYAHDGALVKKGELLFKLSNPQRQQEVLARASDVAQQISNLSSLKVGLV
uniref:hypothetical protein n=1 Tax=Chitinimonas sp. TaxID=1934313 RepID=UPI0035B24643